MRWHYAKWGDEKTACGARMPPRNSNRNRVRNAPAVVYDKESFMRFGVNNRCIECSSLIIRKRV